MTTPIKHDIIVPKEYKGSRLDQALASLLPQYSRSKLKTWIQAGQLLIDSKTQRPRYLLQGEEHITLETILDIETKVTPEEIPLSIIHEDKDLLIINKIAGMVVHPGAGNPSKTLLNALLYHDAQLSELPRGGIIHRLDKETSGLLMIGKTLSAYTHLVRALQKRKIQRKYYAIVNGTFTGGGTINIPIERHRLFRTRMAVTPDGGKPAITHYIVKERFKHYTLLEVQLETGRTHQIRVHMTHIHHPLIGDATYGGRLHLPPKANERLIDTIRQFKRQALHAHQIELLHPITHQPLTFTAEMPQDMQDLLQILREENR